MDGWMDESMNNGKNWSERSDFVWFDTIIMGLYNFLSHPAVRSLGLEMTAKSGNGGQCKAYTQYQGCGSGWS